ncbi:MAG: hypothetical protein M0027_09885 [Candidatus Dormibacteraeota bacterium]|nr:hypothetical protein [Candidatus Dormibacteraeota bacterium]
MSATSAILLLSAAAIFAVAAFAAIHRRDAFGANLGILMGFSAVAESLVAFSASAATPGAAAQLQAYALVVEVLGVLLAGVGSSLAVVLWRRANSDHVFEVRVAAQAAPGERPEPPYAEEPLPGSDEGSNTSEPERAGDETAPAAGSDDGPGEAG